MTAYQTLESKFRRMALVGEAQAMLEWDHAAIMPEGGAAARSESLAQLKVIGHELMTDPRLGDLLDEAEGDNTLDDWQRSNVREMKRRRLHATAVEADLVEASSKAANDCEMVWRKARPASDFKMLLPSFQRVLDLAREIAKAKAERLGTSPYEALLDQFEPGGSSARIDQVFEDYARFLPDFLDKVLAHQGRRPAPVMPKGPFTVDAQRKLGLELMGRIGFDFQHGRLDVSAHPFCGGIPEDVRITTRYSEDDFTQSLMAVLHETGHALYEMGLPKSWRRQPVGEARGMAVHESQSLLIEMQACRSAEFMSFAAPVIAGAFGASGAEWSADNLYRIYTRVARSLIRVEADEVTYPAHVILRYRLEKALIADDLKLADLPGAWNDGMQALLGVSPPDDRTGCLQDIHWPAGVWGYFPTYSLGAMTAAQLFDAATRADPTIVPSLAKGEFQPLLAWLRENVHGLGSKLSTDELVTKATGRPLDPTVFKAHVKRRYLA